MQLYVAGLSDEIVEDELKALFSKVGKVASATVVRDLDSGRSKGFGSVQMPSRVEGKEAIKQLNGTMLGDKQIWVGEMPETLPGELEVREWLHEHAYELLNIVGVGSAQTVLDYGCGPGIFSIAGARIVGQQGKVYALDVSPGALERVRKKARNEGMSNIETILADSSKLTVDLEDECVDVVLLYDVIQEIDNRQGLLSELHRVLKRDGFISVFPMHIGTDRMLEMMNDYGLFRLRDRYAPPGYKTASEVLNLEKYLPE